MGLIACTGCRRHVRASESTCPFCGARVDGAPRSVPLGRRSRAAIFASAATLAACGGKKQEPPASGSSAPAPTPTPTTQAADAAPTPDAALADAAPPPDAAPVDAGKPDAPVHHLKHVPPPHDHPIPKPYGAPPARRRVV